MKNALIIFASVLTISHYTAAQTFLEANDPGNTYEDINVVLAPGYNVVEVPDCIHTDFGRHIDEIFDTDLNKHVFRFFAHVTPDNDRCINFDRQRTEIKTYDQSPAELKAIVGETVEYSWKFKIPNDFQVSPNFTHIHQIKSVGGNFASIPMITLTLRKGNPDRLELRYTPTDDQNTIETADLDLLRGQWVEVHERITFLDEGSYSMTINNLSDNTTLLSYQNTGIDMWQDGADFARPKWGIYRSLINEQDLQDEEVLFADFSINEIDPLSIHDFPLNKRSSIILSPNPTTDIVWINNSNAIEYDSIQIFDLQGKEIHLRNQSKRDRLNVSSLNAGMYFVAFLKGRTILEISKCIVK